MKKYKIFLLIVFCVSCASVPESGFKQNDSLQQINEKKINNNTNVDSFNEENLQGDTLSGILKRGTKISKEAISQRCFSDTVIIWVYPTEQELETIMKSHPDDPDWAEVFEDDASYYNTEAMAFLLKQKEMNQFFIDDSAKNYAFITTKQERFQITEDICKDYAWFIILFDGVHKPVVTAPINLEETYKNYFK
ncbi:MAG: hypothetical protein GX638_17235 [Crenarchaeota archaeon]|jgi:hypothetical protein|nr:hypothetical protein [Thermoproteota archaeon]